MTRSLDLPLQRELAPLRWSRFHVLGCCSIYFEEASLKHLRKGPFSVLLLILVATVMLTGCMPRGAMTNPGWTVVAAEGDVVYAALATGQVVALDAANQGAELWTYPKAQAQASGGLGSLFTKRTTETTDKVLDAVYGIPALTDSLVLVASYNHNLYAFDRASGQVKWGPFSAGEAIIGGATVRDDVAYFGSSDHHVYAVDVNTGEPVWDQPFETGHWVWGAPAVDDERVYFGSMDRHVYAVDRKTGEQVWKQAVGGSVPGTVTLSDGLLFVGGVDKKVHALDKTNGQERWSLDLGHWVWGEALVVDDTVYVSALDGRVFALDVADGSPRWPEPTALGATVRAGPALLNESLIVGTELGTLYKIDTKSGEKTLFFTAEGAVLSTPAIVGEMVYVGAATGNVYALDSSRAGDPLVWRYPPAKSK